MRRLRQGVLLVVVLVILLLGLSWLAGLFADEAAVPDAAPRAVWLTHRWVDTRDPAAFDRLVDRLRDARVTDVYVHVGPLDGRGGLSVQPAPSAEEFAAALGERLPRLRVQAWLGQAEARGGGPLALQDDAVRRAVVRSAERFMRGGYDGVHYDIEPIWDGDADFLALLRETAAMLDRHQGAILSVAAEELPVFPGADRLIRALIPRYHPWTVGYHREVARHVDQVAVMTYDSAMPLPHLYRRFVARNTRLLARALPAGVELLVGVPSYADWNVGHWPSENVDNALLGLRRGLADLRAAERGDVGWALFADWHTDDREWAALR